MAIDTSIINKERLAKGIAALRSGDFKQGMGSLRQVTGELGREELTYCCLGVFTELALRDGCPGIRRTETTGYGQAWFEVFIPAEGCSCSNEECENKSDRWALGGNGVLDTHVRGYYGFGQDDPEVPYPGVANDITSASSLNDRLHLNFDQIAQVFEDTYLTGE